jgi:SAM-dependent methyltransferase
MNWKIKANIVKATSVLPEFVHYQMQRQFGGLKKPYTPSKGISVGLVIVGKIIQIGKSPMNKIFFEVGSGWTPLVPLVLWLAGAKQIITVDLNRYMREELIKESLQHINRNKLLIHNNITWLVKERFSSLMEFCMSKKFILKDFLELCHITYLAPSDAAHTNLPEKSIDYHISNDVFEHIPPVILTNILKEGNRIVRDGGLFIHNIDYSDHFAYDDKNISAINFLQYSDKEWKKIAGNKRAYVNRLRHDDFIALFKSAGHEIVEIETRKDDAVQKELEMGRLQINEKFKIKDQEILSITRSCFTTRYNYYST